MAPAIFPIKKQKGKKEGEKTLEKTKKITFLMKQRDSIFLWIYDDYFNANFSFSMYFLYEV